MNKGKVVILSGASSIGKGEIKSRLLNDPELKLMEAVSITTRPQKGDEVDGKDYFFVDYKLFAEAVKEKKLLEYTEFNGYYYGTPKSQVEFMVNSGKNVLIEVSADGVGPLKLNLPDALAIFVVPESIEQLEEQIIRKYGDDMASAKRRINKARMEMEIAPLFKHQVKNTDIDACVAEIKELILSRFNEA